MRIRARITFEFDAENFAVAAIHEDAVKTVFQDLEARYQAATLDFHEIRSRTSRKMGQNLRKMPRMTGKLNDYEH